MSKKILIVGGVAGGASAAARLRRLDEDAQIIMFERGNYISFANCGLPYYIGETIKDRNDLLVQTPKSLKRRFNIDVRVNSEVIEIATDNKTLKVRNENGEIYDESYDYVVLSPGAKPLKPDIKGIQNNKIFTLRNIPDTDKIKDYVDGSGASSAVIIGGGYVGIEMAESLVERGLHVKLVEAAPHILAQFDSDISIILEKELINKGIELTLNDGVKEFNDNNGIEIVLDSNKVLTSDIVILAVGVTPDTGFLKGSNIKLGTRGHILVNENMQTNVENIYAAGDAIEVVDYINNHDTAIPLAGPANKQGRIAADNISGIKSIYKGTQGTSIIKLFNLTAASTGNNERTLNKLNIRYKVIFIHPASHASYYPGSSPITLKLIFAEDGKILGAQAVGTEGVDKRIDVIATAIRFRGTVSDLTELELCYAPPFSSAKDPVNMAGFVAENVLSGKMDVVTPEQLLISSDKDYLLLDVRTVTEFNNGHIQGALNIPVDDLRGRIGELDKEKDIILYCQVGLRGYIAARILSQKGYKVKNVTGGYKSASTLKFNLNKTNIAINNPNLNINPDTQIVKNITNK